jgi:hypothetical protein
MAIAAATARKKPPVHLGTSHWVLTMNGTSELERNRLVDIEVVMQSAFGGASRTSSIGRHRLKLKQPAPKHTRRMKRQPTHALQRINERHAARPPRHRGAAGPDSRPRSAASRDADRGKSFGCRPSPSCLARRALAEPRSPPRQRPAARPQRPRHGTSCSSRIFVRLEWPSLTRCASTVASHSRAIASKLFAAKRRRPAFSAFRASPGSTPAPSSFLHSPALSRAALSPVFG